MPDFAAYCETCATAQECRHSFGVYWRDKSHGGVGCAVPFRPPWRMADISALAADAERKRETQVDMFEPPWAKYKRKTPRFETKAERRRRGDFSLDAASVAHKLRLLKSLN